MAEYKTNKQVNYGFPLTFNASGKFPIIAKRIWNTYEDALDWVNDVNEAAVAGLQLSVINDEDPKKNGIYFVYNADNEIIYIGKVSNARTASLYMRFKGNGNSSHQKAFWYEAAKQVRFFHFTDELNSEQLKIVERLAISSELPIGDDCNTGEDNVVARLSSILELKEVT